MLRLFVVVTNGFSGDPSCWSSSPLSIRCLPCRINKAIPLHRTWRSELCFLWFMSFFSQLGLNIRLVFKEYETAVYTCWTGFAMIRLITVDKRDWAKWPHGSICWCLRCSVSIWSAILYLSNLKVESEKMATLFISQNQVYLNYWRAYL